MSFPFCKFPNSKRYNKEIQCQCCGKCFEACIEVPLNNVMAQASLSGSQAITADPSPILFNNVSINVGYEPDCRKCRRDPCCCRKKKDRHCRDSSSDDECDRKACRDRKHKKCRRKRCYDDCSDYYDNSCAMPPLYVPQPNCYPNPCYPVNPYCPNPCYPFYNPTNGMAVVPPKGCGYYVISVESTISGASADVTVAIYVNNVAVKSRTVAVGQTEGHLLVYQQLNPGNVVQIKVSGTDGNVVAPTTVHIAKLL